MSGRYREAQDELELCVYVFWFVNDVSDDEGSYLPSFPYSDNPVLHIYAGLISLYTAQPSPPSSESTIEPPNMFLTRVLKQFSTQYFYAKLNPILNIR